MTAPSPPARAAESGQDCGPATAAAAGWPVVVYFHHVHLGIGHYTALPPDHFRRALDLLCSRFDTVLEPASVGPSLQPPGTPSVLITFDDGYRDNLEIAAPLLAEFDVRMLLFCVTDRIDAAPGIRAHGRPTPREDYLTWTDVAELRRLGHVVGAHTRTHRPLPDLSPDEATAEVEGSLTAVSTRAGPHAPAPAFAYPYGLVPAVDVVPPGVLGFGTVKSPPRPWTAAPQRIRRTYLPTHDIDTWPALVEGWIRQWHASPS